MLQNITYSNTSKPKQKEKKETSEWKKSDKNSNLWLAKLASLFGLFCSIIQSTNLFLVNKWLDNYLSHGFGVISLLLLIFFAGSLFWTFNEGKHLKEEKDSNAPTTDNHLTRIVLLVGVILFALFACYFAIYTFGRQELINNYTASTSDLKMISDYEDYLEKKEKWIIFLSFCNFTFLSITIYAAFSCSASMKTWKIMTYFFGIFLTVVCYQEIHHYFELKNVMQGFPDYFEWWSFTLNVTVAFLSILFIAQTFLLHYKGVTVAYIVLGTFFLVTVLLQATSTGKNFRDYTYADSQIRKVDCHDQMGDIHVTTLEGHGCRNKYAYIDDDKKNCPFPYENEIKAENDGPGNCFQDPADACPYPDDYYKTRVWEETLVQQPNDYHVEACLKKDCCGIVSNMYTNLILIQIFYSLMYIILAFILSSFSLHLSTKTADENEKAMDKNEQTIMLGLYVLVLFGGFLSIFYVDHQPYDQQSFNIIEATSEDFQSINIQPIENINGYTDLNTCHKFSDLVYPQKEDDKLERIYINQFVKLCDVTVGRYWWGNPKNNEQLTQDNKDCGYNGKSQLFETFESLVEENVPFGDPDENGYLITISTPVFNLGQNYLYFKFEDDFAEDNYFEILNYEDAKTIQKNYASNDKNKNDWNDRKSFGAIGEKSYISTLLQEKLLVCGYDQDKRDQTMDQYYLITVSPLDLTYQYDFEHRIQEEESSTSQDNEDFEKDFLSFESKKQLPKRHNDDEMDEEDDSTKNHLPFIHKEIRYRYKNYKIQVFDVENDQPIQGADVYLFDFDYKGIQDHKNSEFYRQNYEQLYSCQPTVFSQLGNGGQNADFQGVTDADGQVLFGYVLKLNEEENAYEVSDDFNQKRWIAYVEMPGYSINCRIVELYVDDSDTEQGRLNRNYDLYTADDKPFLDIGLSKNLENDQARVVLEFRKTIYVDDIDLYSTFSLLEPEKTLCAAGPTEGSCGEMKYSGDNDQHQNGITTESITIQIANGIDYLVFLNRELSNTISQQFVRNTVVFGNDHGAAPVVKYYVNEFNFPKFVKFWYPKDYPSTVDFDEDNDLSFLMWCIKGSLDSDVVFNIGSLGKDGKIADTEKDKDLTYYTAWGYNGDPWEGQQQGNNLLPTNTYQVDLEDKFICGDKGEIPEYLIDTNIKDKDFV